MTKKRITPARKPRIDALRNRERILEVAKAAFTKQGATASLEEIAKQAAVGTGTLYRHFPTRDELIEGVYRNEVGKLAAAADRFAETLSPLEALRAWMLLLVDYIAAKHVIAPALNSIAGGASKLHEGSRTTLHTAIDGLVKRGKRSGDLRKNLDPYGAVIGVSHMGSGANWQQSARRLVDILLAGSRPLK